MMAAYVKKADRVAVEAKPQAPLTTAADILERFKDYPALDVVSRRFSNPDDPGSLPILLKDEQPRCCLNSDHQRQLKPGATKCHLCKLAARKWHIHTCNTTIEGRWATMKSKGYVPVLVSELQDSEDVSDLVKVKEDDGSVYVRRGDRGKEITMKQPLEIYNYIKTLQAKQRRARERNPRLQQEELAERAGADLGDEAGSFVHGGGIQVESMTRSKTTLEEEATGD